MIVLPIKHDPFEMLVSGHKTTELRLDHGIVGTLRRGQRIRIAHNGSSLLFRIGAVRRYPNIESAFAAEPIEPIAPGSTKEAALAWFNAAHHGKGADRPVIVFDLTPAHKPKARSA